MKNIDQPSDYTYPILSLDIITSTFAFKCGGNSGTGLLVEHEGASFFATAAHCLKDFSGVSIDIWADEGWQRVECSRVLESSLVDIAVLRLDVAPTMYPSVTTADYEFGDQFLRLGKPVAILGFPGIIPIETSWLYNRPEPLVRVGAFSAHTRTSRPPERPNITPEIVLDIRNDKGFSGGPAVTMMNGQLKIVGLVHGFGSLPQHVQIGDTEETHMHVLENLGFTYVHALTEAAAKLGWDKAYRGV